MILETIFLWIGGIVCILVLLYLGLHFFDRLISGYAKNFGVFWRIIYISLFIKDKNKWLNKIINESDDKKYKIVEVQNQGRKNEQRK